MDPTFLPLVWKLRNICRVYIHTCVSGKVVCTIYSFICLYLLEL